MRKLQILVPAIFAMAFTNVAYAGDKDKLVRATDDRQFGTITDCLKKVGLEPGEDFRQKPGSTEAKGRVQIRPDLFDDPVWRKYKPQIDACFTE